MLIGCRLLNPPCDPWNPDKPALPTNPVPLLPTSKIPALTFKFPLIVKIPDVTALNLPVPVLLIVKSPCIALTVLVKALIVAEEEVALTIKLPKLVVPDAKPVPVVLPFNVAVAVGCQVAVGI